MNKYPWLEHYPKGVPHEVELNYYQSLVHFAEETMESYRPQIAFENHGAQLTFDQLDQLSTQFASYLTNHTSLQKGDRVAIQMPNLLQYPVVLLGILKAGMVVVNMNPMYTPYEMTHQLKDSGAKGIIVLENLAHNLASIIDQTEVKEVIVSKMGDLLGSFRGLLTNIYIKYMRRLVPRYSFRSYVSLKNALAKGAESTFTKVEIQKDDIALLQYTGGTTGIAKGAIITHANLLANIVQNYSWMAPKKIQPKEKVCTPLPIYHSAALLYTLTTMKAGGHNVLVTNPRNITGLIKVLAKYQYVSMIGINTLFNALLNQPSLLNVDFSKFRLIISGGMSMQEIVTKRWGETTNTWIIEGYGLSEASPVVSCNPMDDNHFINTVGIPLPSTVVKVVNENGHKVGTGMPGELLVKGPQVMRGYWNNPEETEKVLVDGWLRTGDVAIINSDGFIKIIDRKKQMINVSGFNVYPSEIEHVVSEHSKVLEVGAVGVPDLHSGEVVKIFVVKKDPTLTAEELLTHCRMKLTRYKVPKQVIFRDSLPKSAVGKILRKDLK